MMNDTVREELQSKVAPSSRLPKLEPKSELAPPPKPVMLETRPQAAPVAKRVETANLNPSKTSPTLVEFQNKNASIPEWRLQMQNAVRQRRGGAVDDGGPVNAVASSQTQHVTHGANALKTEIVEQPTPLADLENADPRLSAALKRIADSRRSFLPEEAKQTASAAKAAPAKSFPFNVVSPSPNQPVRPPRPIESTAVRPKPTMVAPFRMEKKLDTNKLPRIDAVLDTTPVEITAAPDRVIDAEEPKPWVMPAQTEFSEIKRIVINAEHNDALPDEFIDSDPDEIEDLAPFSMRFNAGFFDLIIGVFASMVVLSPFALTGGDWVTAAGLLTFAGTFAIVLFLYMTTCIGFFGKTMGMRLFSLELVDAEGNEYPTLHQAAVNSSLFIISLALGGLGFITVFFNEENRAMHDLMSGTIIVREF